MDLSILHVFFFLKTTLKENLMEIYFILLMDLFINRLIFKNYLL